MRELNVIYTRVWEAMMCSLICSSIVRIYIKQVSQFEALKYVDINIIHHIIHHIIYTTASGVAQWLGRRISDQGVPGSNPGRCTFRCGLEQVTFTLLSTG